LKLDLFENENKSFAIVCNAFQITSGLMCVWLQVSALEQRCQKLELEVQKLAQSWSEAAPTEEIKVNSGLVYAVRSKTGEMF